MAYATVDELAQALRIRVTDTNTPGLEACLDAAAAEIDHDIDWRPDYVTPAADYLFSTSQAAADPGAGNLRLDKANPQAVTACYLSATDAEGVIHGAVLLAGDVMRLADAADSTRWQEYALTADGIDNGAWFSLALDYLGPGPNPLTLSQGQPLVASVRRPNAPRGDKAALANRVNIARGVEWYKANDAAFGVIGFDQAGALTAPRDAFARHAYALTPLKQQWGLA